MKGQKYYTVTQLANKWGISRQGVHLWLRRHNVKPVGLGGQSTKKSAYLLMFKAEKVDKIRKEISTLDND